MSDSSSELVLNPLALEPLYEPWEEPSAYRAKAKERGASAEVVKGRRPSKLALVNDLRAALREWRENYYIGVSDTSRQLLNYWFERGHRRKLSGQEEVEFRYYFCQREAMETLIYLREVRGVKTLSQLVANFGGADAEIQALGIPESEDAWSRFAIKLATGTGKTKVMSLAIVWSYFHALRESYSDMAKHFVMIAPNLTVYERLKRDFADGRIFTGPDSDPLIPPEWMGDWNLSVVLQDAAGGAATGGVLYLTNIHRLYDTAKRKSKEPTTYPWIGPDVSKDALDTGAALRERITGHPRVMVLNDEAHHIWDPSSAWNEAIRYLHETLQSRTGEGLTMQLDFTATPRDNRALPFKHIICEAPLHEAVDGGIVKIPIIGRAEETLNEEPSDNAAYRFDRHLRLGYERWRKSKAEWERSGKKALLFVMCEDTTAADQIAARLNTDETFRELNGKTFNLHTNLKGKVKSVGSGMNRHDEFFESEKEITDEDLKILRRLSQELDDSTSPYLCIVSVLMLREGWDVRNVTTIVPLRPYTSKANILPEQTMGRGLRRMTVPGRQGANELLTCVEHPAFVDMYEQELGKEGFSAEIMDVEQVPATTISIFPDLLHKDINALDIQLPTVTAGHRTINKLEGLTLEDVKKEFRKYKPLPLGTTTTSELHYEGKHLLTGEIIERMHLHLPLLESGIGAISYYVKQLEQICRVTSLHSVIAPLLQTFLEEMLFERKSNLFDSALVSRLGNSDVAEHIRAVFVPLIRARTISVERRTPGGEVLRLSTWKPFQVTHSERQPALEARKTLFNLVPCRLALEVGMTKFADAAPDTAAFAKNAGPQCLRIDYLDSAGRVAFYTPDFFIRTADGKCYMVETKGRVGLDVPRKARAAIAWCQSASKSGVKWEYLYVPQGTFEQMSGNTVGELARTCAPALQHLIKEEEYEQKFPLFTVITEREEERAPDTASFVDQATLESLSPRARKAVEEAITLYLFMEKKAGMNLSPVLNSLLGVVDEAATALLERKLGPSVPAVSYDQKTWFSPYLENVERNKRQFYQQLATNLKKTLVFHSGVSPIGLLRNCLMYALDDNTKLGGVFEALKTAFRVTGARDLHNVVTQINNFRNNYVAHQQQELNNPAAAEHALREWIAALKTLRSFQ